MTDKKVEELLEFVVQKDEEKSKSTLKDVLKKKVKERLLSGLDSE